eukprot:957973_1
MYRTNRDQIPRQIYRNVINAIGYCIYGRDAVDFQNQNIVVIVIPEEYDPHQKEAKTSISEADHQGNRMDQARKRGVCPIATPKRRQKKARNRLKIQILMMIDVKEGIKNMKRLDARRDAIKWCVNSKSCHQSSVDMR